MSISKSILLSGALALGAVLAASAADYSLSPFFQAGSGQAYGDFFDNRGEFYSELGASSFTDTGSYSPYFPTFLWGMGADLAISRGGYFLSSGNRSLLVGLELGTWGGGIKAETSGGDEFASTRLTSLVLAIKADERFRFPLGRLWYLDAAVGPLVGVNLSYLARDYVDGVEGKARISPAMADRFFLGLDLGADLGLKLKRMNAFLGLRGSMGFTHLSSAEGALGDSIKLPWRILARAGCEFPLGGSGRSSK